MSKHIWSVWSWNPSTRKWEMKYVVPGKRLALASASNLRERGFRVKIQKVDQLR